MPHVYQDADLSLTLSHKKIISKPKGTVGMV